MLSVQAAQTQPAVPPTSLPGVGALSDRAIELGTVCIVIGGAIVLVWWIFVSVRGGRWRQPLADVAGSGLGPHIIVVLLVYGLLNFVVGTLGAGLVDLLHLEDAHTPGTHAYHVKSLMEEIGSILTAGIIVAILVTARPFKPESAPKRSRFERAVKLTLVTLLGCLVVNALVTVQLEMGTVLWRWALPNAPPPQHPVLLALHASAWGWWGAAQLAFAAIVVAPLAEELIFRGLLLQSLWRHTRLAWVAIAGSGFVFGLIHFPQPQAVLPLATMGIVLGYVRVRYRSLTACVLIHALFNARTIFVAWVAPHLLEQ